MDIEDKSLTNVLRKSSRAPERMEVCFTVSSISEIKLIPCSGMNLICDCTVLGSDPERLAVIVQVDGGVAFLGGETINFPEKWPYSLVRN